LDDGKWPVASNYQHEFVWSPDSTELFYRAQDARDQGEGVMMAVPVQPDEPTPIGSPRRLFDDVYFITDIGRHFDIAADGKFLMLRDGSRTPAREITVIRNWAATLEARLPAR
jgi:hypothetical protein